MRVAPIKPLQLTFPRPVRAVHQLELTSRCDLRCAYCPSKDITAGKYPARRAEDMTHETFEAALKWVSHYVRAGTQTALNLAGIGESTLHPQFIAWLHRAREVLGPHVSLTLATNGVAAAKDTVYGAHLAEAFAATNTAVWVSLHRPELAGRAVELYRKAGVLVGASADPSVNGNSWAGQVDWHDALENAIPCQWLREGKIYCLSSGELSVCCLDAQGLGVIGHVRDEPGSVKTRPYALCKGCYQVIGAVGYNQKEGQ